MRLRWPKRMTHARKINAPKSLVRKPEGKRPLGKVRCRWMDNISMNLKETEQGGVDYESIDSEQGSVVTFVKTSMNSQVP